MYYFDCCDFSIASEIAWPECFPATREPEVEIRYHNRIPSLDEGGDCWFGFRAKPGALLICVNGVARYLIRGGKEILIEPFPHADEDSILAFLLSSVLAVLLLQRGFLVLNGSVFNLNGEGVALTGSSRAGKSTLVSVFHQMGALLFSDGLCAVKEDRLMRMIAWPVFPAIWLWENTLIQQGRDISTLRPLRKNIRKYVVPTHHEGLFPVPLTKVVELAGCHDDLSWKSVDKKESLVLVIRNTYRPRFLAGMALHKSHLQQSVSLVKQSCFFIAQRNFDATNEEAFFHFVRTRLTL